MFSGVHLSLDFDRKGLANGSLTPIATVTAPHLPSLPALDCSTSIGKRTIQLDLRQDSDRKTLSELIREADVLLQAYRPGALAKYGLSFEEVAKVNPRIVYVPRSRALDAMRNSKPQSHTTARRYASLSAWNDSAGGPWSTRRGFDSLVQHATGFGVAEAAAFSSSSTPSASHLAPRPLPAQALDYASGFLLAFGIFSALFRREADPQIGAQQVKVALAGTGRWVRSFGQRESFSKGENLSEDELKRQGLFQSGIDKEGKTRSWVRHAAVFQGLEDLSYERLPIGLACDEPIWLTR